MDLSRFHAEFERNFTERSDLGASVSVWQDGRPLLDLAAGFQDREKAVPWTAATPVLFWSATKGPAVACVHHVCVAKGIDLESPVAGVWPEFGRAGKERITFAEVLSHQAGLPALSEPVPVTDYAAVIAALESERPQWLPGEGHGYHPRTFGFLLDEIVRRLAGEALGVYWREHFAKPMGLALWIGVPPEHLAEVAPIFPARRAPPRGDPFYTAYLTAETLTSRAFAAPRGLNGPAAMNTPESRQTSYPAFGGIGTAHGLAKFYAMLAGGGEIEGRRYLGPESIRAMQTTRVQGPDRVLLTETAFSLGFMKDPVAPDGRKLRTVFGPSVSAFGQPGAGGSHAFADPAHRVSFAYVMNQMDPGVLPGEKSLRLVEAAFAEG